MEPSRQKWIARLILGAGIALALGWLAQIDYARKISTDVLDLIPHDERSPELTLARSLASERQARVVLFALSGPDEARRAAAAEAFRASLGASEAFVEVIAMGDASVRDEVGRQIFLQRFDLLLPGWLARQQAEYEQVGAPAPWPAWLAGRTAEELESFLGRPEAIAFQDIVPADPLLLLPELVAKMEGLAEPAADVGERALVWALTREAPLSEGGQGPVFAAVEAALLAARTIEPATGLQWAAISRFAAENRDRIRSEVSWLNGLTLLTVLAVAALCLRHLLKVLHLAPILLCAVLAAWSAVTLVFDRVHVLVFVVGSLLGGVAIDYAFYLFLQPPLHPGEPYREKVRRLLKPLLTSALTTILGFSLLLFSDLPLIRQLGVFVSAGLVGALGAAVLWFAQVDRAFAETRAFARWRQTDAGPGVRWTARALLVAGGLVALAAPWHLQWRDDIRELEAIEPTLRNEAQAVRALFGESSARSAYITRGDTPAAARSALARLHEWHHTAFPDRPIASLGLAVPLPEDWQALPGQLTRLASFPVELRAALERLDFEPAEFEPFFTAWAAWAAAPRGDYDGTARALADSLHGPLALSMSAAPGASWFITVSEHPPGVPPPEDTASIGLDQLQSLNSLFLRYRTSALRLSCIGLGLVGLSVLILYGPRRGAGLFALPVGASLFAFGVFSLTGQPLNLFHLLGAFLGVCLSHDYAIFSAENARRGEDPPPSIRLSALTTAASFGVLATSHIPVVSALGSTVALIVLAALAIVELTPLAGWRRPTGFSDLSRSENRSS